MVADTVGGGSAETVVSGAGLCPRSQGLSVGEGEESHCRSLGPVIGSQRGGRVVLSLEGRPEIFPEPGVSVNGVWRPVPGQV